MEKRKIAWVVPPLIPGSGGYRTIFQNVNYATQCGYICDVYFKDEIRPLAEVKRELRAFYGDVLVDNIYTGVDLQTQYDLAIATSWHTVGVVRHLACPQKAYFIQDYEPWFYPMGSDYIVAEQSYQQNLHNITIGRWLSRTIQKKSKKPTAYFDFCADLDTYHYDQAPKENAICCAFQPEKDRRCPSWLLGALAMVRQQCPDLKIYLYGSETKAQIDYEVTELGVITTEQCNELYNKCQIGISLSTTNPSRIPFEMMAAGLPVIELYRKNNLYDLPDSAVMLAEPSPHALVIAILQLLEDQDKRHRMSQAGLEFMRERPLEVGYQQFADALDAIFSKTRLKQAPIKKQYLASPIKDPTAMPDKEDSWRLYLKQRLAHRRSN